jgi:hypothetical protein
MLKSGLVLVTSFLVMALAARSGHGQDHEPIPDAVETTITDETYEMYESGHGGRWMDEASQNERLHLRYLKSRKGGHAQYTHQWNVYHAQQLPWHGWYYHTEYGEPIALVVPPEAAFQTHWGWGVGQTTITPIYHQFARPYPGAAVGDGVRFLPTPRWPSHTDQFGVYYIRGPW